MSKNTSLAKARGKARRLAMQALYQWQMTADDIDGIEQQFIEENDMKSVDQDYFSELLLGVLTDLAGIDAALEKHMSRKINEVDPVERAILRIGTYEFIKRLDVPYRVVLNEAVILSKKFCAEKSHTFVNAVLDRVAHDTRAQETASA
ncbi:MAG: transcription antitermination factor NusB [Gammaproteobacteria bacterium]|nr:transcription antitermination factor NusB [Gammaproteobacteria bacterium]